MPKKIAKTVSNKKNACKSVKVLENINTLSRDELRELLLINTYKLTLTRAQVDAIMEILIKKGVTTYDEVWKKTNEIFKENKKS